MFRESIQRLVNPTAGGAGGIRLDGVVGNVVMGERGIALEIRAELQ